MVHCRDIKKTIHFRKAWFAPTTNELTTTFGKEKLNGLIILYWYCDINFIWSITSLLTFKTYNSNVRRLSNKRDINETSKRVVNIHVHSTFNNVGVKVVGGLPVAPEPDNLTSRPFSGRI
jgi:hypothetical protein